MLRRIVTWIYPSASAVLASLGVLVLGCGGDGPAAPGAPATPAPAKPDFAISDAVFNHGNPHFYWLPPLVANPRYSGTPDGTLAPQVTICEWKDDIDRCGAVIADFTTQNGVGGQTVRYDASAGSYLVNWDTRTCISGACTLDPAKIYRIRVFVGRSQMGFADVSPVNNGSQLKDINTNDYVALVNGRTLPVKFRIEQGAVAVVNGGTPAPVGSGGGTVTASDGIAALDVPAGALSATTNLTVAPAAASPPGTMPGLAPVVELGPSGTQFTTPVVLTLPYNPAQLPQGVPPSALRLYVAKDTSGWDEVPGTVIDEAMGTVSAPITHFSTYTVQVQPNRAIGPLPVPTTILVGQRTTVAAQVAVYQTTPGQTVCYTTYNTVGGPWSLRTVASTTCYTSPPQTVEYPAAYTGVTWSSTSPAVASVQGTTYTDAGGKAVSPPIAGVSPGTANIVATVAGVSSSIVITVQQLASLVAVVSAKSGTFDVYVMNPDGSGLRALSPTSDAQEEYADLSWDARTVVFESSRAGSADQIFRIGTDGTGLTQVTAMGNYTRMPRLSPDGRKVAFYSDAEGRYNVYVTDVTSVSAGLGQVQRVTSDPADDAFPDWSPDMQRIVFASTRSGSWQIYTHDLGTGYERQLTTDAGDHVFPRWQPNGSRIVYRNLTTNTTWTVDGDDGQPPVQVNVAVDANLPVVWSPDGRKLLLPSGGTLYTANTDGSGRTALGSATDQLIPEAWHDAGIRPPTPPTGVIALLSTRGSRPEAPKNDVFLMNPDGTNLRALASTLDEQEEFPDLSPNRSTVVFGSTRTGSFQIFTVRTDNTGLKQLTNLGFYTRAPAWSPDGQRVAFYSNAEGPYNIYAVSASAQMAGLADVQRLTDDPADEILPDWAPDGQRIVYSANATGTYQLYVKNLTTGQVRQITSDAGDHVFAQWAPAGSRVAYVNTASNTLWVVDVDAGTPPLRVTQPGGNDGNPGWSPDGQKLLFGTARAGLPYSQLFIVNADGSGSPTRFSHTTEDLGAPSWR